MDNSINNNQSINNQVQIMLSHSQEENQNDTDSFLR